MKYGMPEHVAFGMSPKVRRAALIVLGTHDGGVWNWKSMQWERKADD